MAERDDTTTKFVALTINPNSPSGRVFMRLQNMQQGETIKDLLDDVYEPLGFENRRHLGLSIIESIGLERWQEMSGQEQNVNAISYMVQRAIKLAIDAGAKLEKPN